MNELIELAKKNPHGYDMDSFVFLAEKLPGKPFPKRFKRCIDKNRTKPRISKSIYLSWMATLLYCLYETSDR